MPKICGRRYLYLGNNYHKRLGGAMWNRYRRYAYMRPDQLSEDGSFVRTFIRYCEAIVWC